MRGSVLLRAFSLLLLCATMAAAVQPLYRVDRDLIFLPLDGVALNAHTGRVAWRFPRTSGKTATDGHGLLMVSWVATILPNLHQRITRFCRLRTADGKRMWCRDWIGVDQWALDSGSRSWYILAAGHLEVLDTSTGEGDRGFALHAGRDLTLLPLPAQGVMLLAGGHHPAVAFTYHPGAAALDAEDVPATLYPFRGDGHGLLLYAREKGDFFLAAPFKLLLGHRTSPAPAAFPLASLDAHGFFFTDWQGSSPLVRGGNYQGVLWQAPGTADHDARLALASTTAVMLESAPHHASQLHAWNLTSGQPAFNRTVAGDYPALSADGNNLVLQSNRDIRCLDASTGADLWQVEQREGTLAAFAQTALVFWEPNDKLVGLARNNGALLWRIQFQTAAFHSGF